nr:uncharacterized protein LOC114825899 [Malus domestica]
MASATSSPSSPIPNISTLVSVKLSESNYLPWESQVKPFLIGQNFWRFVDGTHPCPPSFLTTTTHAPSPNASADSDSSTVVPPVTTSIPNPDYLVWYQTDQTLVSMLRATLTEPVLSLTVGLSTSHQLASIGQPVQNDDLVTYVLNGLGPEYEILVFGVDQLPLLYRHSTIYVLVFWDVVICPPALMALQVAIGFLVLMVVVVLSMHGCAGRYGQRATHQRPGILGPGPATRGPQCWSCNQFGHIAALCPRAPRSDDDISRAFAGHAHCFPF